MGNDYPDTRRDGTIETLHGLQVADPYRWLEDPDSEETRAWVGEQNALSRKHLAQLPASDWFHDTMRRIVLRPRAGVLDLRSGRWLVSRNDGTLPQNRWYVADTLEQLRGGGRLLVDPNTFSADGTTSLAGYTISDDGRWFGYLLSDGGSDWNTVKVVDLTSGGHLDDVVTMTKFSVATWLPDNRSFLYLHYPTTGSASGTEAQALPRGRLMHHRLGTPQAGDALVAEFPDEPGVTAQPTVSHDGRWLFLTVTDGTEERNRLWVHPLETTDARTRLGARRVLADTADAVLAPVRTDGDVAFLRTDRQAPRGKVVRVNLAAEGEPSFEEVVPEDAAALQHVEAAGAELLATYLVDAQPVLRRYALDGSRVGVVAVDAGDLLAVRGEVGRREVVVGATSVTVPVTSYLLDLDTGTLEEIDGLAPEAAPGAGSWEPPAVVTERRRATSADGTEVPYFLLRRADVEIGGPRPTMLYGYGGFNIAITADFRAVFAGWLAAGGVLAIANLRGGSEYGAQWHEAGRLTRKQNVFDDYAAVADHLVAQGVTTHEQLALHGGSNGGLLVGATLTQRPDLAAVALPAVGVFDMLRFHLFTIGRAWVADYGSPEDPELFGTLLAYSPLHNIAEGQHYPATLVLTGDHDDRVVPAHSFKFVAALQHAQAGEGPVLARIETSTGHGMGKPSAVVAAEAADLLAFAAAYTRLVPG